MGKKGLIKLLAAGALVGAAVHMIKKIEDKDRKKAALTRAANKVGKRVSDHAKKVGRLTKANFDRIVETVVREYKDTKELSRNELEELKNELKTSWNDVKDVFAGKAPKKK